MKKIKIIYNSDKFNSNEINIDHCKFLGPCYGYRLTGWYTADKAGTMYYLGSDINQIKKSRRVFSYSQATGRNFYYQ